MAGERERKRRATLVTKALLLGYKIEFMADVPAWGLILPSGAWYMHTGVVMGIVNRWPNVRAFNAPWLAAKEALKLSGVPDAKDVPRDTGVGSGKNYRLRGRRVLRGSFKSLFEKSGA